MSFPQSIHRSTQSAARLDLGSRFGPDRIAVRSFDALDRPGVFALLRFLPSLYPSADVWLSRKLDDVLVGTARCKVVVHDDELIGTLIETPKSNRRTKVSTLFVRQDWRGYGIGTRLLLESRHRWYESRTLETYITVASKVSDVLEPLLLRFGFSRKRVEPNRYGTERHEFVFSWYPVDL